jgi:hypothetical protein
VIVTGKEKQQSKGEEIRKGESHDWVVLQPIELVAGVQNVDRRSSFRFFSVSGFLLSVLRLSGYLNDCLMFGDKF